MRLRVIVRAEWLIVTPVDARGGCPVQRFLEELGRDATAEHRQVLARLRELAKRGRITDERKVRHLGDGIYELKTRGGVRVLYFCLLYTSDAADEEDSVDLGGRRIIKK